MLKNRHFALLALFSLSLAVVHPAHAYNSEDAEAADKNAEMQTEPQFAKAGVGFGVSANADNKGGSATSGVTSILVRKMTIGKAYQNCGYDCRHGYPTHVIEGRANYNVIGKSEQGITTGLDAQANLFLGATMLERGERGCDIYFGGGASIDASVSYQNKSKNKTSVYVGPETGLLCRVGETMLMVSPTVGVGAYARDWGKSSTPTGEIDHKTGNPKMDTYEGFQSSSGFIKMGGRARLAVNDKFYASTQVFYAPGKLAKRTGETDYTSLEGSFLLDYMFGDKIMAEGYGKGVILKDANGKGEDIKGGEVGVSIIRAF